MRNLFVLILFLTVLVNIYVHSEALHKDVEMVYVHKPLRNNRKAGQNGIQETQRQQYNVFGLLMVPSIICYYAKNGKWPTYPTNLKRTVMFMSNYVFAMSDNSIRTYCRQIERNNRGITDNFSPSGQNPRSHVTNRPTQRASTRRANPRYDPFQVVTFPTRSSYVTRPTTTTTTTELPYTQEIIITDAPQTDSSTQFQDVTTQNSFVQDSTTQSSTTQSTTTQAPATITQPPVTQVQTTLPPPTVTQPSTILSTSTLASTTVSGAVTTISGVTTSPTSPGVATTKGSDATTTTTTLAPAAATGSGSGSGSASGSGSGSGSASGAAPAIVTTVAPAATLAPAAVLAANPVAALRSEFKSFRDKNGAKIHLVPFPRNIGI